MTPADRLRPARVSDHAQLSALHRRAALANAQDRAALLAHPHALDLPREPIEAGQVLVLERGSDIVGFVSVQPKKPGTRDVSALFVDPDLWNQGLGRKLIDAASLQSAMAGDGVLELTGNPQARGFYQACGFEETGTAQTEFGTALQMQLNIDQQNKQIQQGTARLS